MWRLGGQSHGLGPQRLELCLHLMAQLSNAIKVRPVPGERPEATSESSKGNREGLCSPREAFHHLFSVSRTSK